MPHDGSIPGPVLNGKVQSRRPPTSPKLNLSEFDFTKPLVWDATNWASEFNTLVRNPPLHSVVVEIAPEVVEELLKLSNIRNRPKQKTHASNIGATIAADDYELTGDTVKFSKSGVLLDGQHRLEGCRRSKTNLMTHVVFGLPDDIFDVLDQGKKRTPGDILALCGMSEPVMMAGAINWVWQLQNNRASSVDGGTGGRLTPRKIRALALGPMKDVANYVKDARLINVAYKHPPTMVAGLLYLIGKHSPAVARDFAHEWVHGAKIGRNKNFDVLQQRLNQIAHGNNGIVARSVRAAMLIQTFNHWHAHIIASPRALVWRKGWAFPTLEFNPDRFKEGKAIAAREDTSLPAVKYRVHYVFTQMKDKKDEVSLPVEKIAELANVSKGSVSYVLGELCRGKQIIQIREGRKNQPAAYQVIVPAVEVSKVET